MGQPVKVPAPSALVVAARVGKSAPPLPPRSYHPPSEIHFRPLEHWEHQVFPRADRRVLCGSKMSSCLACEKEKGCLSVFGPTLFGGRKSAALLIRRGMPTREGLILPLPGVVYTLARESE